MTELYSKALQHPLQIIYKKKISPALDSIKASLQSHSFQGKNTNYAEASCEQHTQGIR